MRETSNEIRSTGLDTNENESLPEKTNGFTKFFRNLPLRFKSKSSTKSETTDSNSPKKYPDDSYRNGPSNQDLLNIRLIETGSANEQSPPLSQTKVFESQLEAFCLDRIITLIATQSHYRQAIYSQPYSGILSAIIARRCFERLKSVMNTAVDSVVSGGDEVFYDSEYVDRLLRQKMNEITIQVLREKSKLVESAKTVTGAVTSTSITGVRETNEDRHTVYPYLNEMLGLDQSDVFQFFAVYDGHGGVDCASFVATNLHVNLARHQYIKYDAKRAIPEAFMQTQKQWQDRVMQEGLSLIAGSTAVTALIHDRDLFISWAGDSSAILFLKSGLWLDFVVPHKPTSEAESSRISNMGGFVQNGRVNGILAVSRSFGDLKYGCVNPEPDILEYRLTGEEQFLLLACDGLTDVLQCHEILDIVLNEQKRFGKAADVSKALVEEASKRGSSDNITVIYIPFDQPLPALNQTVSSFQIQSIKSEIVSTESSQSIMSKLDQNAFAAMVSPMKSEATRSPTSTPTTVSHFNMPFAKSMIYTNSTILPSQSTAKMSIISPGTFKLSTTDKDKLHGEEKQEDAPSTFKPGSNGMLGKSLSKSREFNLGETDYGDTATPPPEELEDSPQESGAFLFNSKSAMMSSNSKVKARGALSIIESQKSLPSADSWKDRQPQQQQLPQEPHQSQRPDNIALFTSELKEFLKKSKSDMVLSSNDGKSIHGSKENQKQAEPNPVERELITLSCRESPENSESLNSVYDRTKNLPSNAVSDPASRPHTPLQELHKSSSAKRITTLIDRFSTVSDAQSLTRLSYVTTKKPGNSVSENLNTSSASQKIRNSTHSMSENLHNSSFNGQRSQKGSIQDLPNGNKSAHRLHGSETDSSKLPFMQQSKQSLARSPSGTMNSGILTGTLSPVVPHRSHSSTALDTADSPANHHTSVSINQTQTNTSLSYARSSSHANLAVASNPTTASSSEVLGEHVLGALGFQRKKPVALPRSDSLTHE